MSATDATFLFEHDVKCVNHKVFLDESGESGFANATLVNDCVNAVGKLNEVEILRDIC